MLVWVQTGQDSVFRLQVHMTWSVWKLHLKLNVADSVGSTCIWSYKYT